MISEGGEGASILDEQGSFDQLTVNEYLPGAGIPPHCDSHSPFEEVFCALSLGTQTVMTFSKETNEGKISTHVLLKP